jgi:hypothetical protein
VADAIIAVAVGAAAFTVSVSEAEVLARKVEFPANAATTE